MVLSWKRILRGHPQGISVGDGPPSWGGVCRDVGSVLITLYMSVLARNDPRRKIQTFFRCRLVNSGFSELPSEDVMV